MEPMGGAARPGKDSYTLLGRVLRPIQLREKLVTGQVGAEAEAAAMAPGDSIEIAWIHPQEPVVRVSIKRGGFDDLPGTDPGNHLDRIGTTQGQGLLGLPEEETGSRTARSPGQKEAQTTKDPGGQTCVGGAPSKSANPSSKWPCAGKPLGCGIHRGKGGHRQSGDLSLQS